MRQREGESRKTGRGQLNEKENKIGRQTRGLKWRATEMKLSFNKKNV